MHPDRNLGTLLGWALPRQGSVLLQQSTARFSQPSRELGHRNRIGPPKETPKHPRPRRFCERVTISVNNQVMVADPQQNRAHLPTGKSRNNYNPVTVTNLNALRRRDTSQPSLVPPFRTVSYQTDVQSTWYALDRIESLANSPFTGSSLTLITESPLKLLTRAATEGTGSS